MHKPFLKPHGFQCPCRDFAKQRSDVRTTESSKAILCRVANVRIAIVERRAEAGQYQEGLEVPLKQNVDVDPLTDVAAVSHITTCGIKYVGRLTEPALYRKPGVEISHVINSRRGGPDLLVDAVRAEVARLVEILREVGT